jgi:hypothetical protein
MDPVFWASKVLIASSQQPFHKGEFAFVGGVAEGQIQPKWTFQHAALVGEGEKADAAVVAA